MPYGYYADPGNDFGNTGAPASQQNETFIQRQRRLQQAAQPASQPKPSGTGISMPGPMVNSTASGTQATSNVSSSVPGTPVSGSGKIPDPQPVAQAPQPVQQTIAGGVGTSPDTGLGPMVANPATGTAGHQPAPAPAPMTTEQLEAAAGMKPGVNSSFVILKTGAMVDRNHPLYQQELAAAKAANPTPAAPAGPAGPGLVGAPGSAKGGAAEASKGVFTQYAAPEHDFQNWQQLDLVSKLLANPETMSPQVIEAAKQKSMEEALLMQKQLQAQQDEQLSAQGLSSMGGAAQAGRRRTADAIQSAILGQNRDMEIQAAGQNRQDQLQALGVAESILGGQIGRGSQVFGNILQGQQANRDDMWKGKQLDLQKELGVGGLNIDQQRVSNQNRQFDAGHGLNILQFLEGQRQHNNSLGFNYNQLNQQGQSSTINQILGMLGR
jgi:hypothetical protein